MKYLLALYFAFFFTACDVATPTGSNPHEKAVSSGVVEMTDESYYELGRMVLSETRPDILAYYDKDGITEKERQHIIDFGRKEFKEVMEK